MILIAAILVIVYGCLIAAAVGFGIGARIARRRHDRLAAEGLVAQCEVICEVARRVQLVLDDADAQPSPGAIAEIVSAWCERQKEMGP